MIVIELYVKGDRYQIIDRGTPNATVSVDKNGKGWRAFRTRQQAIDYINEL